MCIECEKTGDFCIVITRKNDGDDDDNVEKMTRRWGKRMSLSKEKFITFFSLHSFSSLQLEYATYMCIFTSSFLLMWSVNCAK